MRVVAETVIIVKDSAPPWWGIVAFTFGLSVVIPLGFWLGYKLGEWWDSR